MMVSRREHEVWRQTEFGAVPHTANSGESPPWALVSSSAKGKTNSTYPGKPWMLNRIIYKAFLSVHLGAEEANCTDSIVGGKWVHGLTRATEKAGEAGAEGTETRWERLSGTRPTGPCKHMRRLVLSYGQSGSHWRLSRHKAIGGEWHDQIWNSCWSHWLVGEETVGEQERKQGD